MAVYVIASLTIKDPAELHRLFGELGIRERANDYRRRAAGIRRSELMGPSVVRCGFYRKLHRDQAINGRTIERRSHRQVVCNWPVDVLESFVSALSPPTRTTSLALQFAGKCNKM